jgi:hypothetical protein
MCIKKWISVVNLPRNHLRFVKYFIGKQGSSIAPIKEKTGCMIFIENS